MMYKNESLNTLAQVFESIDDPRDERGKRHRLIHIFILAVYGSMWGGHSDFTNMALDLKYNEEYFTELLGLENGIPSHDTFSTVFSIINPEEFLEGFLSWIIGIVKAKDNHVAIDGKAIRAACDKIHKGNIPYIVNAYMVSTGLCIGQIRIDEKTNEIKGIPELLKYLDLEGAVVTIDAIGCQQEIVRQLNHMKADFVISVKENQPSLLGDITLEMETMISAKEKEDERKKKAKKNAVIKTPVSDMMSVFEEINKSHSRIERRLYYVVNNNECIDLEKWPGAESFGMVKRERLTIHKDRNGDIIDEEPSVEYAYHIMSKKMSGEEYGCYARGHWGIENSLHWVLDDYFREDRCTARIGNATENLALLRKILYNLMNLDENVKSMSRRGRAVHYRNRPQEIEKLLFEIIPAKY